MFKNTFKVPCPNCFVMFQNMVFLSLLTLGPPARALFPQNELVLRYHCESEHSSPQFFLQMPEQ